MVKTKQIKRSKYQLSAVIPPKLHSKNLPIGLNSQSIVKEFRTKVGDFKYRPNNWSKNYL